VTTATRLVYLALPVIISLMIGWIQMEIYYPTNGYIPKIVQTGLSLLWCIQNAADSLFTYESQGVPHLNTSMNVMLHLIPVLI
jgi:hypothetical protein